MADLYRLQDQKIKIIRCLAETLGCLFCDTGCKAGHQQIDLVHVGTKAFIHELSPRAMHRHITH